MISITVVGNAGRDPEMRYLESGKQVANFSIAAKTSRGETEWFNVQIWGKQAEIAGNYVKKGTLVAVTGSLKTEKWTDKKTGEEKTKPVITVNELRLLGAKPGNGEGKPSKPSARQNDSDTEEDDIPF